MHWRSEVRKLHRAKATRSEVPQHEQAGRRRSWMMRKREKGMSWPVVETYVGD
jgi:hypothetical protein